MSMPQIAPQPVLAVLEVLEELVDRRVIDRPGFGVAEQVLLADVGDVARIRVLSEQVVERLVAVRADLGGQGVMSRRARARPAARAAGLRRGGCLRPRTRWRNPPCAAR